MGLDNPLHIAFLVVILLLVFGARRLPEIGRSLGSGMREFKDSVTGETNKPAATLSAGQQPAQPQTQVVQPQPQVVAPPQQAQPSVPQPVASPAPQEAVPQPAPPSEPQPNPFGR